ncbi:MAG: Omp28-related outer membrane protein [Crocinitomicaceae bacterium]|nr:Omp28-related outer membrane protein [Crocinitomicaceae bacterium]
MIIKFLRYLSTLFLVAFGINSCDRLENPVITLDNQYLEGVYGPVPNFQVLNQPQKNVLVEEFTGHLCGFCPPANLALKEMDDQLGSRLVVVGIHAGTLASVSNPPFQADYNTSVGDEYWAQLEGGFNPCARIDRQGGPSNFFIDNQWEAIIESRLNTSPVVAMQLIADYVETDKVLNVHVHSQFLKNLSGIYHLIVLLTESHIISPQIWYGNDPEVVTDFEHDCILRAGITDAMGIPLITDPLLNDQPVKSFSFPMNESWLPNNCSVAAFIVNASSGEIVNAVESPILN